MIFFCCCCIVVFVFALSSCSHKAQLTPQKVLNLMPWYWFITPFFRCCLLSASNMTRQGIIVLLLKWEMIPCIHVSRNMSDTSGSSSVVLWKATLDSPLAGSNRSLALTLTPLKFNLKPLIFNYIKIECQNFIARIWSCHCWTDSITYIP